MKLAAFFSISLCSLSSCLVAEPLPPPHTIGLLALPQLYGSEPCDRYEPEALPFFAEPDGSQPVGEIRVDQGWEYPADGGCSGLEVNVHWQGESLVRPLTTEEYGYGKPGAVVTERRGDWYKILLAERIAWIKPKAGFQFRALQDLYREQATYLSTSWEGRLCREPGQYRQCRMMPMAPESAPAIDVLGSKLVDGKLWFQVSFLARGACGEGDETVPKSEGWVPAYSAEHKPTIWFYSRGC